MTGGILAQHSAASPGSTKTQREKFFQGNFEELRENDTACLENLENRDCTLKLLWTSSVKPAATWDPHHLIPQRGISRWTWPTTVFLRAEGPKWPPASRTRMLARGTKDPLDAGNHVKIPSMLMEDGGFISGIPACLFAWPQCCPLFFVAFPSAP